MTNTIFQRMRKKMTPSESLLIRLQLAIQAEEGIDYSKEPTILMAQPVELVGLEPAVSLAQHAEQVEQVELEPTILMTQPVEQVGQGNRKPVAAKSTAAKTVARKAAAREAAAKNLISAAPLDIGDIGLTNDALVAMDMLAEPLAADVAADAAADVAAAADAAVVASDIAIDAADITTVFNRTTVKPINWRGYADEDSSNNYPNVYASDYQPADTYQTTVIPISTGSQVNNKTTNSKAPSKNRNLVLAAAASLVLLVLAVSVLISSGALSSLFPENDAKNQGNGEQSGPQVSTATPGTVDIQTPSDYQIVYSMITRTTPMYNSRNLPAWSGSESSTGSQSASTPEGSSTATNPSSSAMGTQIPTTNIPSINPGTVPNNNAANPDSSPNNSSNTGNSSNSGELTPQGDPGSSNTKTITPIIGGADFPFGFTSTDNQVPGLVESDIIKTDGSYIYTLSHFYTESFREDVLTILLADGAETRMVAKVVLTKDEIDFNKDQVNSETPELTQVFNDMYIWGDTLALVSSLELYSGAPYYESSSETAVWLFDISNPSAPRMFWSYTQSGYYQQSRMIDGFLYVISGYQLSSHINKEAPETFVPSFSVEGQGWVCPPSGISITPLADYQRYTVIGSIDINRHQAVDQMCVLGGSDVLYIAADSLYLCSLVDLCEPVDTFQDGGMTVTKYSEDFWTQITRLTYDQGHLDFAAQTIIEGWLIGQYLMSDFNNRLMTVVQTWHHSIKVYTDNAGAIVQTDESDVVHGFSIAVFSQELDLLGSYTIPDNLGEVFDVRFMDDYAYLFSENQDAPIAVVNLADPKLPKTIFKVNVPNYSSYLQAWSDDLVIGFGTIPGQTEQDVGVQLTMYKIVDPFNTIELGSLLCYDINSEAIYDYRSLFILPERNLIGFADTQGNYYLYGFAQTSETDGCFVFYDSFSLGYAREHNESEVIWSPYHTRAFYVDNYLYTFSESHLDIIDMTKIALVQSIKIGDDVAGSNAGMTP